MTMSLGVIIAILAVIAIGTYFQTVTGFGLGMIVMGVTSGFDLVSVPFIATVVSFVTLVNSGVALPGKLHHIDWPVARAVLVGVVPSILVGVLLLDYLSAQFARLLQFMLGAAIIYSGLVFALRATQLKEKSSQRSFFMSGFFSGLFGGLFGMAGPPVIFHFYRQPMEMVVVRNMLLLIFASTSGTRTVFVIAQGTLDSSTFMMSAMAVPLVAIMTLLGRRYPPPVSQKTLRRIAYIVLIFIGIGLIISAMMATVPF